MEHIRLELKEKLQGNRQWDIYFRGRSVCVLDIETTGLDRRRCSFILGGLYDPRDGVLHQIFARDLSEEAEALEAFLTLADSYDVAVTYNGRHFDMPFMAERLHRSGAGPGVHPYNGYDLDLYQIVNGHSPLRRLLPNLKQKTLEAYMGLWADRTDEISGAESVDLYARYAATGDPVARRQILLHNSDDVLQLTRLVSVLDKCDLHRAMYTMGFPVGKGGDPRRRWRVQKIRTHRDRLLVEGIQPAERMDYRAYSLGDLPVQTTFDAGTGTFRTDIPIQRQAGLVIADLEAAEISDREFQKYPGFGSGFLVLEDRDGVKYREVNHLVRAMIDKIEAAL